MTVLWMLLMLATADPGVLRESTIEATIRGTTQPLDVVLLLRDDAGEWHEMGHKNLPPATRQVRFDRLATGVYQMLVRGPHLTEQFATKISVGTADTRRTTITISPFLLTGRVSLGGTELGSGVILIRHREFHWRAAIAFAADSTFRGPFWQRGAFTYTVRGAALPTEFAGSAEIQGPSQVRLDVDIPDGRITGVVRDAKSGAPVAGATVALQTNTANREDNVKLTTNPDGRFDFTGIRYGRHIVRILSSQYLDPEPIAFSLDPDVRLRTLDIRLDPGRMVPITVIDRNNDPVAGAKVFAVTASKLRARTTTDEDGRASVPVPAAEAATLFVVAPEGPFGMLRIARDDEKKRVPVYLPRTSSSLLLRAMTTDGKMMPPFSLLMRFNGELVPIEVAEELTEVQGLQLTTGRDSETTLRNIPSGSYEFWPFRSTAEAESIVAAGAFVAPIQVNVRVGENKIAVKFAAK